MSRFSRVNGLVPLLAPLLFLVIVISSIFHFGFDKKFLFQVYETNQIEQRLAISRDDLYSCTHVLFDQIQGLRDDLSCEVEVQGAIQPFFNQREEDHMMDVQNLYTGATYVLQGSVIGIIAILSLLAFEPKTFLYRLYAGLKKGYLFLGAGLLLLGLFIVLDFQNFWILFHQVFFRNDLWLLNPATDRLIHLVPQNYFEPLVLKVFFTTVLSMAFVYGFVWFLNRSRTRPKPNIHIVLFEPEIPQNTGNIMRTCAVAKLHLHLIEPTSFILDEKKLRRSGMDYIEHVELTIHDDLNAFLKTVDGPIYPITRYGKHPASSFDFTKHNKNIYFIFGKESTGLPSDFLKTYSNNLIRIPMHPQARSLNLSNSVAIIAYEALRQFDYEGLSFVEHLKGNDWINQ